jgi:hypothetical protein
MAVVTLAALFSLILPAHAAADAVLYWNEIAENASITAGPPPVRNRIMAIVQVAVHDALNSIQARYESYSGVTPAAAGASVDAAVAAATHMVLSQIVPGQAVVVGALYDAWLDGLPGCPSAAPTCITDGILAGEAAAAAILTLRQNDGSATPHRPYTLAAGPGVYQPTPTALAAPQFAGWAQVTPFVINSASQFRAEPSDIFNLTGKTYTRDYNEVKRVGSMTSETTGHRTADQSAIARFWPGGGANFNALTRVIVAGRGLDAWEHARLLAWLNMAISDSTVTVFDTKYTYNFWRPVTAIRAAGIDGNPATQADPNWLSYQATPPYPDYTCGLPNNGGAAFEVLRRYLGTDEVAFTLTAAGLTRSYSSLSQASSEVVDARVFGGIHFRTGCVRGERQGRQVGHFVVQHSLKRIKTENER